MNSSRSSSLVVVILVLGLAAGAASAVTVSEVDAPSSAEVGTDQSATIVLTELYQDPDYEQWTLRGETELENVTWTVQVKDQAGSQLAQPSYDSQSFEHDVAIDSGAAEIEVSVTGTVPPVANYTYDPAQQFLFAELTLVRQGGTSESIQTYQTHHYTEESQSAREAIDGAQAAIDEVNGHEEAERTLESAISAYENENFQNAIDLADQAAETARSAQATQSRNQLILMAVGALILIGVIVGAVVYWRRTRTHSRL